VPIYGQLSFLKLGSQGQSAYKKRYFDLKSWFLIMVWRLKSKESKHLEILDTIPGFLDKS